MKGEIGQDNFRKSFVHTKPCLWDFVLLVQCGVFEGQGVPCDSRITLRQVTAAMLRLERKDPGRYAACEQEEVVVRPEHALSPDDVERMYRACRTHRESAVLALLVEAAYRAGAIERGFISKTIFRMKPSHRGRAPGRRVGRW